VLATRTTLPAYAVSPRDPGPVGQRVLPSLGSAYYDNFYDGPPTATTPAGEPWKGAQLELVYWCYYPENTGSWVPTGAAI
jgi:hypothetical protein